MKAYVHQGTNYQYTEVQKPTPTETEVLVRLSYAGLNRRDLYIANRRGENSEPLILGSDGAGVIEETGSNVSKWKNGDKVIINPSLNWFENSISPPSDFDILGMPDHGTFAEYIVIDEEQIEPKPEHLSFKEASVLALAGLTGYRALVTKGHVQAGTTVFIPGAGSGVATYLIQIAKALDARVIVTSRSAEKRKKALELGADKAIDTASDWEEELTKEEIDLVIDSIGGNIFKRCLEIVKKGGRIVIFGATTEDIIDFDLRNFFYGQYELIGSTMASRDELREMLALYEKHQLHPVIDQSYLLKDAEKAFESLEKSNQFGKITLEIGLE